MTETEKYSECINHFFTNMQCDCVVFVSCCFNFIFSHGINTHTHIHTQDTQIIKYMAFINV